MRRFQHDAKENRRIRQLHLRRLLHCPTAHQQQSSQATRIQLPDFREIKHQHPDTIELLDPAPELVERCPAHHASRAVHDCHVLQAFDLKLEFHISVHTNLPWKKFRARLSFNWTREEGKSNQRNPPSWASDL